MKKIILLFVVMSSLMVTAQNFPGEKIDLLANKELRVIPLSESSQKYGYKGFYTDASLKKLYKEKDFGTPYKELSGKTFKVLSFEPYKTSTGNLKHKLKIENSETDILFFDYDPKYSHSFPFEVIGGLQYPEGFFCERMLEKEPLKENSRKYEFPFANGVKLIKTVDEEYTFIFAAINLPTDTKEEKGTIRRGVTITFDNGKTISMPDQKVNHTPNGSGGTVYSAVVSFTTPEELDLLKNHKMAKVKFDKFEREIREGDEIREYAKCFLK